MMYYKAIQLDPKIEEHYTRKGLHIHDYNKLMPLKKYRNMKKLS